ncbi:hypothetical protein [Haloferax volcanii]|uniref:Uncharacterized protein n=1 Tax=Haloferax volcanii JCM 10717 TaxID=1227458 RepID=M0IDR4_HALVO|nr:hypothetical protein [Haloferax alexandrinus]ELZ93564.1 hypothetical protein C452_05068 [Haloferax alexandrinus JCM 10717]
MDGNPSETQTSKPNSHPTPGIYPQTDAYEYFIVAGDEPAGDDDIPKPISLWISTDDGDYPVISETGDEPAIFHAGATHDNDPEPLSERARVEIGQHAAEIIDRRVGRREVVRDWREDSHPLLDAEEEWAVEYLLEYVANPTAENDALEALVADCVVHAARD